MYAAADFPQPFGDAAGGLGDTVSYTSRQPHTHTHAHVSCSAPNQNMQHFSRKSTAGNFLLLHTKNYVYFPPVSACQWNSPEKPYIILCLLWQLRAWVASWEVDLLNLTQSDYG